MDSGITYKGGGSLEPIGYVDPDYAGCKDTRQSTKGNIFYGSRGTNLLGV